MIRVNRGSFMRWTQGHLMSRYANGMVIVDDNQHNENAMEALERGETVELTKNGQVISTILAIDGEYKEKLVDTDEQLR